VAPMVDYRGGGEGCGTRLSRDLLALHRPQHKRLR
jgi:hypothetical protein